jgi:transcriptional regulator with XRE-family HTH domain
MSKQPLDFTKIEALRKHMLLTKAELCKLIGVSRMAYHGWLKGTPVRATNDEAVRSVLRQLVYVVRTSGWPQPEVKGLSHQQRFARLLDLIKQQ